MSRRRPRDLRPGQSLHSSPGQAAAHRPTGPGTTTAGPRPTLPARPVGNPGQAVPTHRAPHQGTLCLCGRTGRASGQQRRRAQPAPPGHQSQDQRRHPLGARHTEQDNLGLSLRHLARPGSKSSRRLPSTAHFPATLNCYGDLTHSPDYPTASQTCAKLVPERLLLHATLTISPSIATAGRHQRSCVATSLRPHPHLLESGLPRSPSLAHHHLWQRHRPSLRWIRAYLRRTLQYAVSLASALQVEQSCRWRWRWPCVGSGRRSCALPHLKCYRKSKRQSGARRHQARTHSAPALRQGSPLALQPPIIVAPWGTESGKKWFR